MYIKKQSSRVKPNPFIKCFDILCLEQYINNKQTNKTEDRSDTDSVNNELNNPMCYNSNVNNNSNTEKGSKGTLISKTTNCMNSSVANSLTNTPHTAL